MKMHNRSRYRFSKEIRSQLYQLTMLDNWHGILALCQDYLVIGIAIMLSLYSSYFYPITLIIIGARQGALANLAHEAGHNRLTKNKRLNYFIGTYLTGYLIFQEMKTYIDSHIKGHHGHLGDKSKDPDYFYHIQVGLYKPQQKWLFFNKYILTPLYLGSVIHYMRNTFANRAPTFFKYKTQALIMTAYLLLIILLLGYFGFFNYFLIFWIIPFFTVYPIIGWFIELVEHYPLVGQHQADLYMTRNRFSHPIEHFIFNTHNEHFHLVHHLNPAIPFWNLKKAHEILLKDQKYMKNNDNVGGIFFSSNSKKPFIKSIMEQNELFSVNTYGV